MGISIIGFGAREGYLGEQHVAGTCIAENKERKGSEEISCVNGRLCEESREEGEARGERRDCEEPA